MKSTRARKRDRVKALFWRTKEEKVTNAAKPDPEPTHPSVGDSPHDDRGRSKYRYSQACNLLQETVKACHNHWGMLDFLELFGEHGDADDSEFIGKIELALNYWKQKCQDQGAWGKCKSALQDVFKAFSPLAKNFLQIAIEGQSVTAFLLPLI